VRFAAWHAISFSLVGDAQEDALRRLDIPTLVLYGAADTDYTGEPTAKAMCAVLPRCTPVAFLQSGHWPFLEEPVRFQQVVGDFLTEDPFAARTLTRGARSRSIVRDRRPSRSVPVA
jgi:pimeloyl-ACP methyl ester carboxylesterase